MSSCASTAPRVSISRQSVYWLLALVALAIGARAWLHFSTPLVPGINGAYYLVQARSLLEHGALGIPDLPFTFWLQSAFARLLELVARLPQDTAIVWAVKLSDSILPPLAALPVFWLTTRWPRNGEPASTVALLVPAAAVALGSALLDMTGNFQKNALALVWLAALAPAAFAFLRQPALRTMAAPLLLLGLLGLTHIGVLGAALVFCGVLATVALLTADRAARRKIFLLILLGAGVLGLAGGLAYKLYDPARVTRLLSAIESPASFGDDQAPGGDHGAPPEAGRADGFTHAMPPPSGFAPGDAAGMGPGFDLLMPPPDNFGFDDAPPAGQPGGHGPGHGGMGSHQLFPMSVGIAIAVVALWLVWRQRKQLSSAELSVAAAAAVTTLALALPLHDEQKAERLLLIAAVPAAIAGSFIITRIVLGGWSRLIGACALVFILADSAMRLPLGGRAVISDNTFAELASLKEQCTDPERTLVVAHHGLEWWTAWTLHTHIAQPRAVSDSDWQKFDQVLYLQEKEQMETPDHATRSGGMAPGPGQPGPRGGGPGGGAPGGPDDTTIPENARTIHDGATLTLALVPSAPAKRHTFGPPPGFRR